MAKIGPYLVPISDKCTYFSNQFRKRNSTIFRIKHIIEIIVPVALQQSHCVCIIIHCNNSHSLKCSLWFRARRITWILNRSCLVPISDLAGPYLVPISEKSGPYLVPIRDFFQYAWSCHHWDNPLSFQFDLPPGTLRWQ